MRAIRPDFAGMVQFCHTHGIETIAVFCLDCEDPDKQLHVRDFCPAVGVSESAAAGTTNAALTSYLLRHSQVKVDSGCCTVNAEQGIELCHSESPDCILLDYKLPLMSGLDFLARLQGDEETLPVAVVMMTAEGDQTIAVEAMKRGGRSPLGRSSRVYTPTSFTSTAC